MKRSLLRVVRSESAPRATDHARQIFGGVDVRPLEAEIRAIAELASLEKPSGQALRFGRAGATIGGPPKPAVDANEEETKRLMAQAGIPFDPVGDKK